ncbi:endonuclease domain-containing protein [Microterricola viridarii]|uniref:DUF559 domain-containing protein n=1 Tax=Microterricola viridarii TaxID=412690 RepID=A0A1H1XX93_9MICO|nr:hypothetical protein [Microterricola viridarii]SDT13641.1 hypothetical protein SAMN04489834_2910 [Microterricola viridarii]
MHKRDQLRHFLAASGPLATNESAAIGITPGQLRHRDVLSPFRGVVMGRAAESVPELAAAYAKRMPRRQYFSHSTAALLHGIPLPAEQERALVLHVSTSVAGGIPRCRGVVGHQGAWDRSPTERAGLRLSAAVHAWCELASLLAVDDLVAAGDFLVTGDEPYSGIPPLATLEQLTAAVRRYGSRRYARRLRQALALVRYGSMSRMESLTRLAMQTAGLPEPRLNHPVFDEHGTQIALIDLAYPEFKVGIEYQGDGHRDRVQYRNDTARRERLEDRGWTIVYVTADDLRFRLNETMNRIRTRLRQRGARF